MPLLVWTAKYSVNIRELDAQHQRLFAMINELYDAMQAGVARSVIVSVLDRMLDYAAAHFAREEALFREHAYPEDAAHRAEHAALTWHTKTLKRRLDGGAIGVPAETLGFLVHWLEEHILGSDMRYTAFLNERGVN
jgi:hemerythrin